MEESCARGDGEPGEPVPVASLSNWLGDAWEARGLSLDAQADPAGTPAVSCQLSELLVQVLS